MQIVCLSRGTFEGGKELAEKLAAKLGVACLGREEVTDAATRAGIPVGKLEMAIVRPQPLTEHLAVERDRFKAFITAALAERALAGGVVYHGRTGHLVLPSVSHMLRVRAIMDPENRIGLTMRRLRLDRERARKYIAAVDEDRRRWARSLHNVDWDDPAHYDLVVSLDHVSVESAATALVAMAQLPELQPTPASRRTLENLLLASQCRLAIGDDLRTHSVDVSVRAEAGQVSATYHPRHEQAAEAILEIIKGVPGVASAQCTMASTNILWVQEHFDPSSPTLAHLLEIAAKWNAAVGLARLTDGAPSPEEHDEPDDVEAPLSNARVDAGILDDAAESAPHGPDGGLEATMSRLLQEGRAGGRWTVHGGSPELVKSLDRSARCSLVVVGDVFTSKGDAVRKRMTRELEAHIGESLRVPVIAASELEAQYLFGAKHWVRLLVLGAITATVVWLVLSEQVRVLGFMRAPGTAHRVLATALLVVFVPTFAAIYGTFSQYLLRLLKFE